MTFSIFRSTSQILSVRSFASPLSIGPARSFALTSRVFAPRADPAKEQQKQLKNAQKKLAKEKSTLKTLEAKHKAIEKKHNALQKERIAQEELKALKQALKPYRLITGLNVFIKENVGPQRKIGEVAPEWNKLSESEKAVYKQKANEINEQQLKLFPPKPKRPANAYATFIRERWYDGEANSVVMKELSVQWGKLSQSEKDAYKPDASLSTQYTEALKAWKQQRIENFKKHGGPSSTA